MARAEKGASEENEYYCELISLKNEEGGGHTT